MIEFLYHNKGNGTFEEIGLDAGIGVNGDGHTYAGMGIDFQDFDNDGLPDLVITNLANEKYALHHNNGDGPIAYSTYSSGIARIALLHSGWGIHFFDFDNDGLKDLLVAQGHDVDNVELNFPQIHYKEPMLLMRNLGKGVFSDVSKDAGPAFQEAWVSRGLAIGDLDNDGRLDAVISTNGGPAHILHKRNRQRQPLALALPCRSQVEPDAIGAEIKITTAQCSQYDGQHRRQLSFLRRQARHFGLGPDAMATKIETHWPSGIVQTLTNVRANRILRVEEPATSTQAN